MKKLFLALLSIFNLYGELTKKEEKLQTNFALTIAIYNLFHDYKLPVQDIKAFFKIVIERFYLDKDMHSLHSLKNKLEKLTNKENKEAINSLQFEIDDRVDLIKQNLLPIL